MLRSRKQKVSSTSSNNNEDSPDRMKTPYGDALRSSTTNVGGGGQQHKPLIPTPFLIGIVVLFLLLGVATEHYKRTRGVDPFTGRVLDAHEIPGSTTNVNPLAGKSLLSSDEDMNLEYKDNQRYHVIFSTDCSPYQHWQRYVDLQPSFLMTIHVWD